MLAYSTRFESRRWKSSLRTTPSPHREKRSLHMLRELQTVFTLSPQTLLAAFPSVVCWLERLPGNARSPD